jgi:hypothetical protein
MLLKYSISEKRSLSCDTRARYCDALCADTVTLSLFRTCAGSVRCSGGRVRVGIGSRARWCAGRCGLCVQQWFGWAMSLYDYNSSHAALCCVLIHQNWWAQPLPIDQLLFRTRWFVVKPCAWAAR